MKADLRVKYKPLYAATAKAPVLVDVPALPFLTVDGEGDPNGPEFQDAIGALYGTVYTLKFMLKAAKPARDFSIMPLEGLWWCEGIEGFDNERRELWRWTLMIMLPDFADSAMIKSAVKALAGKRGKTPALGKLKVTKYREGSAVQMLHVGPYSAEQATLLKIDQFINGLGMVRSGKHHEIYLSDPRRTAPEKLKTILRVPVKKAPKVHAAKA
jgi:hypothetical protein